jgi:hypothetical protein
MITAAAASKKAGGESSVNLAETLDDNPDASVGEVSLAYSLDLALGVKKSVGQDWDKQENSAWDNFTGMYDLATVGLNLMALSGGQGTLTQNLGIALSAGRAAKVEQEEQGLAASAAARAEGREDAALRVTQADSATKALDAASKAADRVEKAAIGNRNADSSALSASASVANAYTSRMAELRAAAEAGGVTWQDSTATAEAGAVAAFADSEWKKVGEIEDGLTIAERNKVVGQLINTKLKAPNNQLTPAQAARIAVAEYMQPFENTAMFGTDWEQRLRNGE